MVDCKLCGAEQVKLAKAHIIPKSLYGGTLEDPEGPAKIIAHKSTQRPKRSRSGEYDNQLVCRECEKRFDEYDDYAAKVFKEIAPTNVLERDGRRLAYAFEDVDKGKLNMFFHTLLWRMGATSRDTFQSVSLGPYQERLREAILERPMKSLPQVDAVVCRFDRPNMGLLFPTQLKIDGVFGYRVVFDGHTSWLKVDNKPFPSPFDELALSSSFAFHMLAMNFFESAESRAMIKLVKSSPFRP